jgi:vacuolar-type H+-ATPase subunit E/Vma4
MGLEKLVDEVRRRGEAQAQEILSGADSEAAAIVAKAQAEADALMDAAVRHGGEDVAAERAERLSEARSAALKQMAEARRQVIEAHLRVVWAGLLEFRDGKEYGRLVSSLAAEAATSLGPGFKLMCRRGDEGLLAPASAAGNVDCAGGVLAYDVSGRIMLDGRLETLFSEAREALSAKIYAKAFREGP